jgi:protein-S-isoprenylcysteine O-methyltransferase Ste14
MYISAGLVVAGEAVLFWSFPLLVYFALFVLTVHVFVLLYEEPTLRRMFGDEYESYLATVRRWIPRPPAGSL